VALENLQKEAKNNCTMIVSVNILFYIINSYFLKINNYNFHLGLNISQPTVNVSPDPNLPLLSHGSVVLGKNSVVYKNANIGSLPVQLPAEKLSENIEGCDEVICDKDSVQ
jgi:hypothetical protein